METGLSRQAMEIGTYRQRKVDYRNVWSVSVKKNQNNPKVIWLDISGNACQTLLLS